MSMQRCAGCGIEAEAHPFVGIGQPTDEMKDYQLPVAVSARGFAAYGVCEACHKDPAHRRRPLKLSFFFTRDLGPALAEAGSNSVAMGGRG